MSESIHVESRQRAEAIVAGLKTRSLNAAIKRVHKARDAYRKKEAIERFCEWGERVPVLWAMVRAGHLEVDDPHLWSALSDDLSTVDHQDAITLLSGVMAIDPAMCQGSAPGWPESLDVIACGLYARAPGPLVEAAAGFSADVARGFATVRLRFGDIARDALPGDPDDWAARLAEHHLERYGLGMQVVDAAGPHRYVRWPARGSDDPKYGVDLWVQRTNRPSVRFYEYIGLYTTLDRWREAVLARVRGKRHGVDLALALDAFAIADVPTLADLFNAMISPKVRAWAVLDELRDDLSPTDLLQLIERLEEHGRDRIADVAAAVAVKRLTAANEPVPEAFLKRLRFAGYESGYGSGYGTFFEARERYLDALQQLPEGDVRAKMIAQLTGGPYPERPLPFVADYLTDAPDDPLWEAALTCLSRGGDRHHVLSHWMIVAHGMARLPDVLGLDGFNWLAAAWDQLVTDPPPDKTAEKLRDGLAWALIAALASLADQEIAWPEAHDRFLRFDLWEAGREDHAYLHYVNDDLARALTGLPADRLAAVFERGLDPERNPAFTRPFGCMRGEHITDLVIQMGLNRLVSDGDKARQPYQDWYARLPSSDWLGERLDPFLKLAMWQGLPEIVINAFKQHIWGTRWEALQAAQPKDAEPELPSEPVARLAALCAQVLDDHPELSYTTLYALRSIDEPPAADAINRVEGLPIGVTRETWPRDGGELFMHVLTIDLDQLEDARPTSGGFEDARALALFLRSPGYNEAWEPGNDWVRVLPLTDEDLANGVPDVTDWDLWEESNDAPEAGDGRTLEVVPILLPQNMGDDVPTATREAIRKLAYGLPGEAGGYPEYIQDDPMMYAWDGEDDEGGEGGGTAPDEFVLQFDERLAGVNLGDMGMMYVFTNTAFWQCY